MSTDMYGVRVLAVNPDELRARLRVFVVYYDVGSRTHVPLPNEEPNTFLHFLWEAASGYLGSGDERTGPLGHAVSTSQLLDYEWADANARRFISRVERVELRNVPLTDDQWADMHDFYYVRDGSWKDEDLLVQAEYEIRVTDRRWLEPLTVGDGWGSAAFPLNGDSWSAEDSPHIPDLARPAVTLRPFQTTTGDTEYDHVNAMGFSDDGAYLAVCSDQGRVWVYDTADWSEVVHTHAGDWIVPLMMWVPGGHVLVVKSYSSGGEPEEEEQWAYDVDRRSEVEAPFQRGHLRSPDGTYRISPNGAGEGGFDLHGDEREPFRRVSHAGGWDPIQCTAFSGDSSRLFLGAQENLYTVDPATGEVIDKIDGASTRLFALAANKDGGYLAVGSFSRRLGYLGFHEERPHELCVWRMADKKIIFGRQMRTYVEALSWSPDNRWLAAALEPLSDESFNNGSTELVVFPMGPVDD